MKNQNSLLLTFFLVLEVAAALWLSGLFSNRPLQSEVLPNGAIFAKDDAIRLYTL